MDVTKRMSQMVEASTALKTEHASMLEARRVLDEAIRRSEQALDHSNVEVANDAPSIVLLRYLERSLNMRKKTDEEWDAWNDRMKLLANQSDILLRELEQLADRNLSADSRVRQLEGAMRSMDGRPTCSCTFRETHHRRDAATPYFG